MAMNALFKNTEGVKASIEEESFEKQERPETSVENATVGGQEAPPEKMDSKNQRRSAPKRKNQEKKDKKMENDYNPTTKITPKSPTIYLLQDEKKYLDRLKAYILLETGEKTSDHELVMKALEDYVKKNYKEFAKKI